MHLVLLGLFFLSGAAGLSYQIAWTRMLSAGMGHEIPAMLAVVASIFGGMAAGAWVSDSVLNRSARPGRWYGWLELIIGGWGLLSILLIPVLNEAAIRFTGLDASAFRQWLVAFGFPVFTLLPATASMGATFPAMQRLSSTRPAMPGVGALYAANTFGAVMGILMSIFVLLPELGFSKALILCSITNLICGATALGLEQSYRQQGSHPPVARSRVNPACELGTTRFVVTLGLTGMLGIGYEVLGVRALTGVLENTIYSFAAVLTVFLIGIATGAAIYQIRARRFEFEVSGLLLGLSTACMLGVWVLSHGQSIYRMARSAFGDRPIEVWSAELMTAGLAFLWPTLWMGALFGYLLQTAQRAAIGIGCAIAWNTLGSTLAPLVFGVLLLPAIGLKWSFATLALAYLTLLTRLRIGAGFCLMALFILIWALPVEIRFIDVSPQDRVVAFKDGVADSVAVIEHADGNRSLLVDNRFMMGGTGAASAERRHAEIPLLLHPHPSRALFLGLGTGITFAGAATFDELRADGVELVPEIVNAMSWFEPLNRLPRRFSIFTADARRFVRTSTNNYDVIVADLFHPARDGAGALYSLEHFRGIQRRMAPDGLFCQWLPLFQLDEPMLRVIIRTFLEVFPQAHAFILRFNVDTPVLGLVGPSGTLSYDVDYWNRRVGDATLRDRLKGDQLRDRFQLFGCHLAGPTALRSFSQGAGINTDDRPIVVFGAPAFNSRRGETSYGRLQRLLSICSSDLEGLFKPGADPVFIKELDDYIDARNQYLSGLIAEAEGNSTKAIDAYVESARRSQHFSTGYAQCLTLATQEAKTNPHAARQLLQRLIDAQPERPVAAQLLQRIPE